MIMHGGMCAAAAAAVRPRSTPAAGQRSPGSPDGRPALSLLPPPLLLGASSRPARSGMSSPASSCSGDATWLLLSPG